MGLAFAIAGGIIWFSGTDGRSPSPAASRSMLMRVPAPNGILDASTIAKDATGVFDVIIFSKTRDYIYSSAEDFPAGFHWTKGLRIEWDVNNHLVMRNDGGTVGYWYWDDSLTIRWRPVP